LTGGFSITTSATPESWRSVVIGIRQRPSARCLTCRQTADAT
jgi:hypothetical protein